MKELKIYYNGFLKNASENDSLNGIIVYEVIRIINGKPLFLQEHLQRLYHSLELSLNFQLDHKIIEESIFQIIHSNQLQIGNIELQINDAKELLVKIIPHSYPTEKMYSEGVCLGLLKMERSNPNAKQKNQTLRDQANFIMQEHHFFEVLLVDKSGFITEGSRSNVFFVKENKVFTPPTNAVLQGITREKIFEICQKINISLVETKISLKQLPFFDAAFLTGTSPSVLPIQQIEQYHYSVNNLILKHIKNEYQVYIEDDLKKCNSFL